MFGHGGLTTLGVNAMIMGFPALIAHHIFRLRKWRNGESHRKTGAFGFLSGVVATGISVAMFVVILLTNLPAELNVISERAAIYALAIAHIPVIFIEGTITALITVFLRKVRPGILDGV
jgi:cobalt/nickel transport system permease protein